MRSDGCGEGPAEALVSCGLSHQNLSLLSGDTEAGSLQQIKLRLPCLPRRYIPILTSYPHLSPFSEQASSPRTNKIRQDFNSDGESTLERVVLL